MDDLDNIKIRSAESYHRALAADNHFQELLEKEYGCRAGDARYWNESAHSNKAIVEAGKAYRAAADDFINCYRKGI